MSFDAHEEKIGKIFAGDSRFTIPRNQRRYVWGEKQWQELLGDIKYIKIRKENEGKDIEHFLGSFVLQENKKEYEIIDGQQRITTLFLILSAICLCFNKLGSKEEHGKTRQYISGNIGLESQFVRLKNNSLKNVALIMSLACEYRDDFDEKYVLSNIVMDKMLEGNRSITKCINFYYEYFSSRYDNIEDLIAVREIVLGMKVIHIAAEDELDCYDIFEILNARGIDLEESELLKNYIFKYAQPEYDVDRAKDAWAHIENNIEECNGNMELFLSHFVTYRYHKPSKDDSVFHIIKAGTEKTEVYKLLEELIEASGNYIFFYHPEKMKNEAVRKCLELYKLINHRQFRPLVMALLDKYNNNIIMDKQITDIFTYLRNFSFAFTVVMKYTSNIIDAKIHELSHLIYTEGTGETIKYVKQILSNYYPSRDMFVNSFANMGYSNKNSKFTNSNNRKRVKYIMVEIENSFQPTKELACNCNACDLEHIMCDSATSDVPCMIGNILLIYNRINNRAADDSFEKKKIRYTQSQLINVKKYMHHYGGEKEWTEELIKKRTNYLADYAYNHVWHLI